MWCFLMKKVDQSVFNFGQIYHYIYGQLKFVEGYRVCKQGLFKKAKLFYQRDSNRCRKSFETNQSLLMRRNMDTGHSQANYLNTNHPAIVCQNETACGKKATSLN